MIIRIQKGMVKSKLILSQVMMRFRKGTVNAILGRNGAGKSSLFYMITEHPEYSFKGNTYQLPERIFMTFQKPPEIPEMTVGQLLLYQANEYGMKCNDIEDFKSVYQHVISELEFPLHLLDAVLNKEMSGGENKKLELFSLYLVKPDLILLDEIDTGLDLDTMILIGKFLRNYVTCHKTTVLITTHNMEFLRYFDIDTVFVLEKGRLVGSYNSSIIENISANGFIKTFEL